MSTLQRCLVMGCCIVLAVGIGCTNSQMIVKGPPPGTAASATFSTDSSGNCEQNGVEGGKLQINSAGAKWIPPNATSTLEIQLAPGCGFSSCSFGPGGAGAALSSGTSTATNNTTILYQSIKIDGQNCTLNGDGMIMK